MKIILTTLPRDLSRKKLTFPELKGGRAVYEANLLRGSAMIGTGKIFDMVVPMGIYKRFMKKKNLDYQVLVGNPGPFLFLKCIQTLC